MGRLSEFFNQHRDNVEEGVAKALEKADATIDSLSKKVEQLEQRLRDVAGEAPKQEQGPQNNIQSERQGVVTSDQTKSEAQNVQDTSVAEAADRQARARRK